MDKILIGIIVILIFIIFILWRRQQTADDWSPQILEQIKKENAAVIDLLEEKFIMEAFSKQKDLNHNLSVFQQSVEEQKSKLQAELIEALEEKANLEEVIAAYEASLSELKDDYNELSNAHQEEKRLLITLKDQLKITEDQIQALITEQKREAMKHDFYRLNLTEQDKLEIAELESIASRYAKVRAAILAAIYSHYFATAVAALCNRVLGGKSVSGIYKITNTVTGEIYVGRSVDVKARWSQHIKRAVGVEKETQNKLYPSMREYKVWNFSFELLQEAPAAELPALEKVYQEVYRAKEDLSVK